MFTAIFMKLDEIILVLLYIPTYLPTYLPACLPAYLPTYLVLSTTREGSSC
jgi:hypothetical protein